MKSIIKIIIILILFLFQAGFSQSLKETVKIALEASPGIASAREQLRESKLDAKSTHRSTLPQLDFSASYQHVTDRASLNLPGGGPLPGMKVNLGVFDTYETGLMANYILFSGFAQKNLIELKDQTAELNNQQMKKTEKTTALDVIVKYRQIQNSLLEIDALHAGGKRIDLQVNRIKSLAAQGMALALDTLSLSLSRLNNEQKIIAANAKLETERQELNQLAGQKIQVDPKAAANVEQQIPEFETNQIDDLKMLNTRIRMMKSSQSITRAGYFPNVGLFAGVKYAKPGVDFIANDWMTYGVWGVNLNWNLFKWNADHLKIQSQQAAIQSIQFQYQVVNDRIRTKYDNAIREFEALKQQYSVALRARDVAKKKMEIVESRYKQGMSSVTDFNEANLELTDAEINLQRQKILLALKISEIDFLSGKSINEWRIEQ
jgi:outer membrane protein